MGAGSAVETVASVLRRKGEQISVDGTEAAVRALAAIVALDGIEDANKKRVATGLAVDAAASAASLARVLRGGSGLEARIDAAGSAGWRRAQVQHFDFFSNPLPSWANKSVSCGKTGMQNSLSGGRGSIA